MSRTVVITGANGFIGTNLAVRLRERGIDVREVARDLDVAKMASVLEGASMVFHCAGVNRPLDDTEFAIGNVGITERLCQALENLKAEIPVIYTSSIQALSDNPYGRSKQQAEKVIRAYASRAGVGCAIYRLPNVFGKWSRPAYNSVVATFCHNILNGLPITIHDPASAMQLVYIDDLVAEFIDRLENGLPENEYPSVKPVYSTTVGELAETLRSFHVSRETLNPGGVGDGLRRGLYATFLSFMKPEHFAYDLVTHRDPRGEFAEMLRTENAGQFSFFTAHPGVTRGGHYHHTKNEKFLVVQGKAQFRFRHVLSNETAQLFTEGSTPRIVETVPGWAHDITNVGKDTMIVLLWANENFDPEKPDTIVKQV
ncbi:NAD-dependent epimerase/dehydratase family protein [Rhizobium sp. BK379]|jgi:UDP-2-acetamido-2,6-beta-L-arabino-hexul-4-ose reductase|uniref:UDP-2-acetamido-2,6-beta-L-arabino-hexul-4-ose reductase n=1 Tax=Rhizobium sp. BK379 TaxID=2587059 RepID=UPI000DDAD8DC|nr:NAD-dependent epimerase/dehydratase family protein [Rhizobium sp. BK379]MBB3445125.1 UDP-2-acetamido-2,6-beta-L-arabino-hexul-4-ose reductase [Rhizobium sp. BK379]